MFMERKKLKGSRLLSRASTPSSWTNPATETAPGNHSPTGIAPTIIRFYSQLDILCLECDSESPPPPLERYLWQQREICNTVKCFRKIKNDHISLSSSVCGICKFMNKGHELCFTAAACSESIMAVSEYTYSSRCFNMLLVMKRQWHRTVVAGFEVVPFLENGFNIYRSPVIWNNTQAYGLLEDCRQWWRYLFSKILRILAGIMSGPQALFGLMSQKLFNTFFGTYDDGHWLASFSCWFLVYKRHSNVYRSTHIVCSRYWPCLSVPCAYVHFLLGVQLRIYFSRVILWMTKFLLVSRVQVLLLVAKFNQVFNVSPVCLSFSRLYSGMHLFFETSLGRWLVFSFFNSLFCFR